MGEKNPAPERGNDRCVIVGLDPTIFWTMSAATVFRWGLRRGRERRLKDRYTLIQSGFPKC